MIRSGLRMAGIPPAGGLWDVSRPEEQRFFVVQEEFSGLSTMAKERRESAVNRMGLKSLCRAASEVYPEGKATIPDTCKKGTQPIRTTMAPRRAL